MNYSFYYSKNCEEEIHFWMNFLKAKRGIRTFPDIPAGEVKTLAWHNGKEICFKRIGLRVGQLIIKTIGANGKVISSSSLCPYIMYQDGEPEDKLVLDEQTASAYNNEQDEVRKCFFTNIREGIVPFT